MARTIAGADLGQATRDRQAMAVRAGRHVAVDQRIGEVAAGGRELCSQLAGQPALDRLVDRTRMVGDQPAQHRAGSLVVAQVTGAIQRMEPRGRDVGRVADVMQPRGSSHQVGIGTENRSKTTGGRGDSLSVSPAARQRFSQELAGGGLGPVCLRHRAERYSRSAGTCTDAPGQLKTSPPARTSWASLLIASSRFRSRPCGQHRPGSSPATGPGACGSRAASPTRPPRPAWPRPARQTTPRSPRQCGR